MSETPKKTTVTGWLRDGVINLQDKFTGKSIKKWKTPNFKVSDIGNKNKERWLISTLAGFQDRGRGFYRKAVPTGLTGKIIRFCKLTQRFIGIYIRPLQDENEAEEGYGRFYITDTNVELNTNGVMRKLKTSQEVVVYKVKLQMQVTSLLWELLDTNTDYVTIEE